MGLDMYLSANLRTGKYDNEKHPLREWVKKNIKGYFEKVCMIKGETHK